MSQVVTVSVQASKEALELGQGVAKFLGKVLKALDDGWQPGQDIPVVITAAIGDLVPALDGVTLMADEFKDNPAAFYMALGLSAKDIAALFTK